MPQPLLVTLQDPNTRSPLAINVRATFANAMLQQHSIRETFDLLTRHIFLSAVLSTNRTRAFGEHRTLVLPYCVPLGHLENTEPLILKTTSLHIPKIRVWTIICSKSLIGFFCDNKSLLQHNLGNLNDLVAWTMFWSTMQAPRPHRTTDVLDFLKEHFDDRVSALRYSQLTGTVMDRPPYLQDLTLCDFFLWGYLKH